MYSKGNAASLMRQTAALVGKDGAFDFSNSPWDIPAGLFIAVEDIPIFSIL